MENAMPETLVMVVSVESRLLEAIFLIRNDWDSSSSTRRRSERGKTRRRKKENSRNLLQKRCARSLIGSVLGPVPPLTLLKTGPADGRPVPHR